MILYLMAVTICFRGRCTLVEVLPVNLLDETSTTRNSASFPDPHSMAAWIRFRIPYADLDPEDLERAQLKK
jgi:hypothetical protein